MIKTLMAVAIAGAFGLPLIAQASVTGDNIVIAQAGGGGDTGASSRQPGVNPPGDVSPGTPRSAVTGADRDTGAAGHANPSGGSMKDRHHSGSGATHARATFDRLDKNHDGYISRDEAANAAELNTRFSELDRNNDGKLSRDEYNALHAGARGATGTGSMSGSMGSAPGKGPGAQEPATRSSERGAGK